MSHKIWTRWIERLFTRQAQARLRRRKVRGLGLELLEDRITPATNTWVGLGANTNWSTPQNWSLGRIPAAGDDLVFGAAASRSTVDNINPGAYNSVSFSASGYTIAGGPFLHQLVVSGAFNVGSNLSTETISVPVQLNPSTTSPQQTITVGSGSTLDFTSTAVITPISGSATLQGSQTLYKAGGGTLELDANDSSYTGAVNLAPNGGIVLITNPFALGTGAAVSGDANAGITTVNANAQLQVQSLSAPVTERLKLNGPGVSNDGALLNVKGTNTWSGNIELDSDSYIGASDNTGNLYISGIISDLGAGHNLTKVGIGPVTFSHVGGNTYRGTTTIDNGVLAIQDPLSLGAGANANDPLQSGQPGSETIVNYNGPAQQYGTLEINYNPGAGVDNTNIPSTDPNAILQNPSLPYNAATNPIIGFQVFNDLLVLNGPGWNPADPTGNPPGASTTISTAYGALYNAAGANGWDGNVMLGSNTSSSNDPMSGSNDVSIGAATGASLTVSGVVSEPNSAPLLRKVQPGEVIFNDANTYSGGTEIDQGILSIRDSQALGTSGNVTVEDHSLLHFPTINDSALYLEVDSGLDGTPLRTHNRNLGFDSMTHAGQGLIGGSNGPSVLGSGIGYDNTNSYVVGVNGSTYGQAEQFTPGSDLQLDALTLALANVSGSSTVSVTINKGSPTGPQVDDFTFIATSAGGLVTETSTAFPTLTAGTPYWIVATSTGNNKWYYNNTSVTQNRDTDTNGGGWVPASGTQAAFMVNDLGPGQEVYIPSSVTAGTFTLTFEGATTAALPYYVSANALQAALDSLSTVKTATNNLGVFVTQDGDVYRIAFGSSSNANVPLMTLATSGFTYNVSNPPAPAINPIYGLTLPAGLNIDEAGMGVRVVTGLSGAVDSVSGINTIDSTINLGSISDPNGSIGSEIDARPGHTTADNTYLAYDYRLTLPTRNQLVSGAGTTFYKEDTGQLVMPASNGVSLLGPTIIAAGWITAEHTDALGSVNQSLGLVEQTDTINVDSGGSLQLLFTVGNSITLPNNLYLAGVGIPSHNFGMLTEGAVLNLGGENELTGLIQLTSGSVGIGVDDPIIADLPSLTTLTTTNQISGPGGISKLGSHLFTIQGPGIYTGSNTVVSGTLLVQNNTALGQNTTGTASPNGSANVYTNTSTAVDTGALLELGTTSPTNDGGVSAGVQVWNEDLVLNGQGQQLGLYGSEGKFTLSYNGTATQPIDIAIAATSPAALAGAIMSALLSILPVGGTVSVTPTGPNLYTVVFGGTLARANNPLLVVTPVGPPDQVTATVSGGNYPLYATADNLWQGGVTLASSSTLEVAPNSRLTISGAINDLPTPTAPPANLTINQAGSTDTGEVALTGPSTYRGNTYVSQGVLTVGNSQALGASGGPEIQQYTVGNSGTYTLSFNGYTISTPLAYNALPSTVQAALDGLLSIGGVGGAVDVTQTNKVFTVSFDGGSLFASPLPLMTALGTAIVAQPSEFQAGYGQVVVSQNAQIQMEGNISIAGKSLVLQGNGVGTTPTNVPLSWVSVGPSSISGGQTSGSQDVSGRVTGVAVDPQNSNVMYLTSAGGGAWKTINNGQTWTPLFDGVNEEQQITIPAAATTFTLSFGADTTGPLNNSSQTLALDIQNALNALPNIGGVGGSVTVTQAGDVFTVTFLGALAGNPQGLLTATDPSISIQPTQAGVSASVAMYSGAVAVAPTNWYGNGSYYEPGTIYLGTGEADNSGDSYYGTGVYVSHDYGATWSLVTGLTYEPSLQNGVKNPLDGTAISRIVPDPSHSDVIYVSSSTNATNGGGTAGVWRFIDPTTYVAPDPNSANAGWTDLTSLVSYFRRNGDTATLTSTNPFEGALQISADLGLNGTFPNTAPTATTPGTPPNLPNVISVLNNGTPTAPANPSAGPDDNFNLTFPTTGVYSDLTFANTTMQTLYERQPNPSANQWSLVNRTVPALYIALGTPDAASNSANAVYRMLDPFNANVQDTTASPNFNTTYSLNTVWDIGDGNSWLLTPATVPFGPQLLSAFYKTGSQSNSVSLPGSFPISSQITNITGARDGNGYPIPFNGNIKITSNTGVNGGLTLYAAVTESTKILFPGGNTASQLDYFYVSTDGGHTWTTTTSQPPTYQGLVGDGNAQGAYDSFVALAGNGDVYVGGVVSNGSYGGGQYASQIYVSHNGGGAWNDISVGLDGNGPHTDEHAGIIDSNGNLIVGNDGGIWRYIPTNPGDSLGNWTDLNGNLTLTTLNGAASAPGSPQTIIAGSQDNGTEYTTGTSQQWTWTDSGDGGQVAFNPNYASNHIAYKISNGSLYRATDFGLAGGPTWSNVLPGAASLYFPITTDLVDPHRILAGGTNLEQSLSDGASGTWVNLTTGSGISDITAIGLATYQGESGINGTYLSDPSFPAVGDLGANTYDPGAIYVVHTTRFGDAVALTLNNGISWIDRTSNLPGGTIEALTVDPRNRNVVFAVIQNAPGFGNAVYESTDAGQNWTNITTAFGSSANLPDVPFWSLAVDPRTGTLYLGTDIGVFSATATDGLFNYAGSTWARFGQGMPDVSVHTIQLDMSTNTLTAATYGRGVYQFYLDNVTANSGALRVITGKSVWNGPVLLAGSTNIEADGTQTLPQGMGQLDIQGVIADSTYGANNRLTIGTNSGAPGRQGTFIFSGGFLNSLQQSGNAYGGTTTVQSGVLVANSYSALGTNTVTGTTVNDGAALELSANLDNVPVDLHGDGFSFNSHFTGSLRNISGNWSYAGNITLDSGSNNTITIGADSNTDLTLTGVISASNAVNGGYAFVKEGTGTVTFTNANTYALPSDVYQGALQAENSNALSTGKVEVLDGAQVQVQNTPGGNPINVPNVLLLSGTGVNSTGALLDTGGNNTWSGGITLTTLPGFSPFTTPSGVISLGVTNEQDTLTVSGAITQSPPDTNPGKVTFSLLKVGAGNAALQSANHYDGTTEVQQGTLTVQNVSALGDRPTDYPSLNTIDQIVTLDGAPTSAFTNGAKFTVSFDGKSVTGLSWGSSTSTLATQLDAAFTGGGGLFAQAGIIGATLNVTVTPLETTTQNVSPKFIDNGFLYTLVFGGSLANTTIPVLVTGTGGVIAAAGTVAQGGIDTIVDSGATLAIDSSQSGTPAGFTVDSHTLTLNGTGVNGEGALYNAAGNNTWQGPIFLASTSYVGANTATTLSLSNTMTADGTIAFGTSDLNIVDLGTVQFTPSSSFASPGSPGIIPTEAIVSAGTLEVDSTAGVALVGGVLLDGGTLAGTGNVGLISSISTGGAAGTGGTVHTGTPSSTYGTLTSTGATSSQSSKEITLDPSDAFLVNIGPHGSGSNDILNVVSAGINLNGATLDGIIGSTNPPQNGDSYTIIRTDYNGGTNPSDIVTGTFAGLTTTPTGPADSSGAPQVATISWIQGEKFEVDYYLDKVTVTRELATVNITLAAGLTSPVYGQDEKFTATVVPEAGAPAPSGNIVFTITGPGFPSPGTQYTVAILASGANGAATLDIPQLAEPLAPGTYTVTASFDGTDSHGIPTYNPVSNITLPAPGTVTVGQANSTTVVTIPNTAPIYGQGFTLTATVNTTVVSPVSGTAAPSSSGSLTFYYVNNGTTYTLGAGSYAGFTGTSSKFTFDTSSLASPLQAGNYAFYAVYAGDTNYLTSTSANVGRSILQDNATVNVNFTVPPPAPAVYGEAGITYTATVAANSSSQLPTGTVTFTDGAEILGTGTLALNGGTGLMTATYTTVNGQLPVGTNQTITATYNGDNNFQGAPGTAPGTVLETVNKDSTSMTMSTSAPDPTGAVYGQPITFTATVNALAPGYGNPTGLVTFKLGGTTLGTGTLTTIAGVTSASYTTTVGQLSIGTDQTISVSYNGDGNFIGTTGTITQTVNKDAANVSIVSLTPSSVTGQQVTFRATVSAATPGAGNPTGTVTFYDNGVQIGTGSLSTSGSVTTATYTTTLGQLQAGSLTITATYGGDSDFLTQSNTTTQTVAQANTATNVITSLPIGSVFGQPVTFTATVKPIFPGGAAAAPGYSPTGTVTFSLGGTQLGQVNLTNGTAVYMTTQGQLPVGNGQTVTATYSGDSNFNISSGTVKQTVTQAATTTSVSTSVPSGDVYGEQVMFSATITPVAPGAGAPGGTVQFYLGSSPLGTPQTVVGGTATLMTTQVPVGANETIRAVYSGDGNFTGSSGATTQTVGQDSSSLALASSASSGAVYGQPVTFTATVTANTPGSGLPSGTVTFTDTSTNTALGTGMLKLVGTVMEATYTTSALQLPLGTQVITATYGGDGNFTGSSNTLNQSVTNAGTGTTLSSSLQGQNAVYGQPVTFTATVAPSGSGSGTPTGTVTFTDTTTNKTLGTATLSGGVATYVTTVGQLPFGANQIKAVYSGDNNFSTSMGADSQNVIQSGTTTSVSSSAPSGSSSGQSVTLTAVVAAVAPGNGSPTGSVTFSIGGNTLGTGNLSTANGVTTATYTTTALPVGSSQTVTVTYGGDTNFAGSSGTTSQTVADKTTTTVASSVPTGDVYGEQVTFTATITPGASAGVSPGGTVTFLVGNTPLGTVPVSTSGGVTTAVYTTSAFQLPVGSSQTITAQYTGDATFLGSSGTLSESVAKDGTATSLSASSAAVLAGQPISFTATVTANSPGSGVPAGTVTFTDSTSGATLGTVTLSTAGVAVLQTALAGAKGNHTIVAVYNGNVDYTTSQNSTAVSVSAAGTRSSTVTVKSSLNPSHVGQTVIFTATVKDAGTAPVQTPTGLVAFYDGTALLGTATLSTSAGVTTAAYSTAALTLGTHSITAKYIGNATFASHTSSAISQTVAAAAVRPSSTSVVSSLNPSTYGQSVTFTATVTDTGSGAAATPTGTVQFYDGTTFLGNGTLSTQSSGVAAATFSTAALAVGDHGITAVYAGNSTFAPGNPSSAVTQTVNQVGSQTSIASSAPNGSVAGQAVTFKATVTLASGHGIPTGAVTFYINGQALTPVAVATVNGVTTATLTTAVAVGGASVYAVYSGDTNVAGSTSPTIDQSVNQASTKATISASTTTSNKSVTFTAAIAPVSPGAGIPTGSVTFFIDGINEGPATLNSAGKATFTLSGGLSATSHTIQVVYSGDANYLTSTASHTYTFTVGRGT
jgi:autotransporter-associated beta strand protein